MYTEADATLSDNGIYRYRLTRAWEPDPAHLQAFPDAKSWRACFVMLNPSTADGTKDDPTIRKCVGFAKQLGCTSLEVVNLFAYRSTNPKALHHLRPSEAIGPDNDGYILTAACSAKVVIAAWGVNGRVYVRDRHVRNMLASHGVKLQALRLTKKFQDPEHPLYIPYGLPLVSI